jgi:CheY-like chemotaxis protein
MPETKIKLLVVDDEPEMRILLSQIFGRMGHSVTMAEDGFSALERIREATPDVLISDLNMPGMSGFELLSVVRRRLPAIYVIATSGAYAGKDVPHGIVADAFYEKASGIRSLLGIIDVASRAEELDVRRRDSPPIWVPLTDSDLWGESYVAISCPECLRAFPEVCVDSRILINQTECVYCHTTIRYAVVEPLDPLTSQPYVPKRMPSRLPAIHADFDLEGEEGGGRKYG